MSEKGVLTTVEFVRGKHRKDQQGNRKSRRNDAMDSSRYGIDEVKQYLEYLEKITPEEVTKIAKKIKRNRHASQNDMQTLSQAFLQDPENIATFLNITGALDVLVKDLTGHDADLQMRAAETICNLTVEGPKTCYKVLAVAGSYIATFLDSTDTGLQHPCIVILINAASMGSECYEFIESFHIMLKLLGFLQNSDTTLHEDVLVFLIVIAECPQGSNLLKKYWSSIREVIFKDLTPSNRQLELIFKIISNHDMDFTEEEQILLVDLLLLHLRKKPDLNAEEERIQIYYDIGILGNLFARYANTSNLFIQRCSDDEFSELFNHLVSFGNIQINKLVLWMVGNLDFKENISNYMLNILSALRIRKSDLLISIH